MKSEPVRPGGISLDSTGIPPNENFQYEHAQVG